MLQCLLLSWPEQRALSTKGQTTGALIGADTAAEEGWGCQLVRMRDKNRERAQAEKRRVWS